MSVNRQKIFVFTLYSLLVFSIICYFLVPKEALAGFSSFFSGMEPACKVLKTNTTAQSIWKTLLNTVNSLAAVLLIIVAFIEILRINVSTYGVKKILPTLLLAIVASNFSYLVVRFLVDIANVAITLFAQEDMSKMLTSNTFFKFPEFEWSNWFSELLNNLVVLAAALLMYALAFLFIIRNWVIYFLAIVSPVAMMTLVLPQTKSLFSQWWQNLIRWIFMPVVSLGLLWLATRLTPLLDKTPLMGSVIIGAVLYFAITMPFKLGGNIMSAWSNVVRKPTGRAAKWGWGKAKSKWVDPFVDDVKGRLNNFWLGQASGSRWNPLGNIVRHALHTRNERELTKRETEGKFDQGTREAYGGKYDDIEGLGGKYLGRFYTAKDRLKDARRQADIDSLFGESTWTKDHLKMLYLSTPEGFKQYALNSHQYKERVDATAKSLNTIEQRAKLIAESDLEDEKNPYFANKQWAAVHYFLKNAVKDNFPISFAADKRESDANKTVEELANKMSKVIERFRKAVLDFQKSSAERKTAEEALRRDPNDRNAQNRFRKATADEQFYKKRVQEAHAGYQDQQEYIKSKSFLWKDNKLTHLGQTIFGRMIGDKNGQMKSYGGSMDLDNSEAVATLQEWLENEIKEIVDVQGITGKDAREMVQDRTTKRLSILAADEKGAEMEKRKRSAAMRRLIAKTDLSKAWKNGLLGRFNSISGEHDRRALGPAQYTSTMTLRDSEGINAYQRRTDALVDFASDRSSPELAYLTKEIMSQEADDTWGALLSLPTHLSALKQQAAQDLLEASGDTELLSAFRSAVASKDQVALNELVAGQASRGEFQGHFSRRALEMLATKSGISPDLISPYVEAQYDADNNTAVLDTSAKIWQVKNLEDRQYQNHLEMLKQMFYSVNSQSERGADGAKVKNAAEAAMKKTEIYSDKQIGNAEEEALDYDPIKTQELFGKKRYRATFGHTVNENGEIEGDISDLL